MKAQTSFICQQCGYHSPSFLGKCPECGTWNSLVETIVDDTKHELQSKKHKSEIVNLKDIEKQKYERIPTQLIEFDRVLGGGIVQGSVILLSGDPGIGKSTLLTQLALNCLNQEKSISNNILYVAGEESAHQIKLRTDRIKPNSNFAVLNETDVDNILENIKSFKPKLVIVDSIQTLQTLDLHSVAGSVGQVRECAHRLQELAKRLHIPIILVGHVTKEGNIAGPKTLEHLVDVVLILEGDPASSYRIIRASKNRFGSVDEVGIFEMTEAGMQEVLNPSKIFLEQRVVAPGSAVVATMGGLRPLLVEIQALVTKSFLPAPRRVGSGIDNNRLQLLVAVLTKRLGLPLFDQDIFVNVTGGMKVSEPAADLAIALSIISSFKDQIIDPKAILVGEIGLLGELRSVRSLDKRKTEGKKLGFTKLICPENAKSLKEAVNLVLASKVAKK